MLFYRQYYTIHCDTQYWEKKSQNDFPRISMVQGAWMAQLVEYLSLDFGCHDPRFMGSRLALGSSLSVEPT